jgi:RNA polymerase sigma-70 factor, ECF subfamily
VSTVTAPGPGDAGLITAARAGDDAAFRGLVAPHLRAVHVHCYRMLGSFHDAEEATQETLLRAWRGLDGYEARAPFRHWLYRIATTTCLKMRARRNRQPVAVGDVTFLGPYPDRLLDEMAAGDDPVGGDPAAEVERRESVSLAFITALQMLPATQCAVLVLRDVLAWSSQEVAELLDTSVPAVNSALQRARGTVARAAPAGVRRPLADRERDIVDGFVRAWHRRDIAGLAALLREDVIMRMPPESAEFLGRESIIRFFATVPAGGRLEMIRLRATRANGMPALAAYLVDVTGGATPYGLMVFTIDETGVAIIHGFPDAVTLVAGEPDGEPASGPGAGGPGERSGDPDALG